MKRFSTFPPSSRPRADSVSGFTLVEMSIVMVIIGLIAMTVFPALNAARTANQQFLTQSNLKQLMTATAAYVQANGCLPCPAIPGNAGSGSNFGRVGLSAGLTCGTCSAPSGVAPFVSLGLPMTSAKDGWGHWITMRVDPALTTLPVNPANCITTKTCSTFVPPTALCTSIDVSNGFCLSGATVLTGAAKGFCAPSRSTSTGAQPISVTIPGGATQMAAVLFISHGVRGYGSYITTAKASSNNGRTLPFSAEYPACSPNAGFAQCNSASRNSAQFYDAITATESADPYDDIMTYADRNMIVVMQSNTACNTVW